MNTKNNPESMLAPVRSAAEQGASGFRLADFHPIYQRALQLESSAQELMSFRVGRVPYWSLLRVALLARLLDKVNQRDAFRDIYLKPRALQIGKTLRYVVESFRRSPFSYRDREIVFFCSGTNWKHQDGAYFNTRADYFCKELPGRRLLLVEGADDLRYAWPRAISPVSFRGRLTVPGAAWSRFSSLSAEEERRVRDFMALLSRAFDGILDASDQQLLGQYLRNGVLRSKVYYRQARKLLGRLRPRIVFLESAHTGFDVEFLAAAREQGAMTVEYQHGAINPFCPYHNFHPDLLAGGYADFLPHYFLSYGDYWNGLLTTSATIVSVGNPHISASIARTPASAVTPGSVYVLSSASSPEESMGVLREIAAHGFSVVFRPHPVERPLLDRLYGTFFRDLRIEVDLQHDFYGQLRRHEFVVGDGRSTSLFEAYALAPGRVFVMEPKGVPATALPNHPFLKRLRSPAELAKHREGHKDALPAEALFCPDWQRRFARVVDSLLAGAP